MRRGIAVGLLFLVLAAAAGTGFLARDDAALPEELQKLDQLRHGGRPDFDQVDRQGKALLAKYTRPEEQAQIYYALAHLHIQSSRDHYDLVIDYAKRALELPLGGEQRLRLFVYWGDALRNGNVRKPFAEIRKMAAVPYLQGLKDAKEYKIPDEKPAVPVAIFFDVMGDEQSPEYQRAKKESDDSIAAQKRALEGQTLWDHRRVLIGQIVDIYAQKPYAPGELRELATTILEDSAAVDKLMKLVDEKIKERSEPLQRNSNAPKTE